MPRIKIVTETTLEIKLSEEDKLFIQNNLEFMSSVEMGRLIFKDNNLTNLNQEVRVIADYVKELTSSDQSVPFEPTEEIPAEEYKPPKTFDKTMYRVNYIKKCFGFVHCRSEVVVNSPLFEAVLKKQLLIEAVLRCFVV